MSYHLDDQFTGIDNIYTQNIRTIKCLANYRILSKCLKRKILPIRATTNQKLYVNIDVIYNNSINSEEPGSESKLGVNQRCTNMYTLVEQNAIQ